MTATAAPPTAKHAWPVCAGHPDRALIWRTDGFGWICPDHRAAGHATPQPWQPGAKGSGAVPITPKGRRRPDPARSPA